VDIPAIDVLVNLAAGKSMVGFTQKFGRGLRRAEGKDHLVYIDFYDTGQRYLRRHSEDRFRHCTKLGQNPERKPIDAVLSSTSDSSNGGTHVNRNEESHTAAAKGQSGMAGGEKAGVELPDRDAHRPRDAFKSGRRKRTHGTFRRGGAGSHAGSPLLD
jgi:superfamily II DNA or RNA helicase